MRVHVVVPDGFADPGRPSGGNIYDRRLCAGLAALGWDVRITTVAGAWPVPGRGVRTDLARVLTAIPAGEMVLIDGLIASPSADPLLAHARRLRLITLLHMPLADEPYDATAPSEPERGEPGTAAAVPEHDLLDATAPEPRVPSGIVPEPERGVLGGTVWESERAVLGAAAGVVVTSEWTRRLVLDRYGLPPGRVRAARPGTDPAPVAPRNRAAPANGHLLCVAALARHKGQDVLVEALAGLPGPDWECVLAGPLDREPEYVADLRARVAALGLGGRIRFAGTLTGAALDDAYASADLLVVPSRAETYGMVVTEALAHAVPVLTTTAGGLPEALGHAPATRLGQAWADLPHDPMPGGARPGRLIPPDDPGALRTALAAWLGDAAYRRRLRTAALRRRPALTGWDRTARDVAAALTEWNRPR